MIDGKDLSEILMRLHIDGYEAVAENERDIFVR